MIGFQLVVTCALVVAASLHVVRSNDVREQEVKNVFQAGIRSLLLYTDALKKLNVEIMTTNDSSVLLPHIQASDAAFSKAGQQLTVLEREASNQQMLLVDAIRQTKDAQREAHQRLSAEAAQLQQQNGERVVRQARLDDERKRRDEFQWKLQKRHNECNNKVPLIGWAIKKTCKKWSGTKSTVRRYQELVNSAIVQMGQIESTVRQSQCKVEATQASIAAVTARVHVLKKELADFNACTAPLVSTVVAMRTLQGNTAALVTRTSDIISEQSDMMAFREAIDQTLREVGIYVKAHLTSFVQLGGVELVTNVLEACGKSTYANFCAGHTSTISPASWPTSGHSMICTTTGTTRPAVPAATPHAPPMSPPALVFEQTAVQFSAGRGNTKFVNIHNPANVRVAIRLLGMSYSLPQLWVSGTNFGFYRISPTYTIIEPGARLTISMYRISEAPKDDTLHIEVSNEQQAFERGAMDRCGVHRLEIGRMSIALSATYDPVRCDSFMMAAERLLHKKICDSV